MRTFVVTASLAWFLIGTLSVLHPLPADGEHISVPLKNIARVDGVRENQLRGFGVVVGLAGTGDGNIEFVNRSIANALSELGFRIEDPEDARLENIAAVMVTATLPPFRKSGDKIDVTVSSIGSAEDLSGGVLVQTPLKAGNGEVYAVAQGAVTKGGQGEDQRHLTTVRIPGGAIVEREVPFEFVGEKNQIRLQLHHGDFTTAARVARTINSNLNQPLAQPVNNSTVRVEIPPEQRSNPVEFVAILENMNVAPSKKDVIVINERTGTVLMGSGVAVRPVSISHEDITLRVGEETNGSESNQNSVKLPDSTTIAKVVNSLNSVGASTDAIIAILEAMDRAGALTAPLQVM